MGNMVELVLARKPALVQRFAVGEETTVAVSRMRMPGAGPSHEQARRIGVAGNLRTRDGYQGMLEKRMPSAGWIREQC